LPWTPTRSIASRLAAQGDGLLSRTVEKVKHGDADALRAKVRAFNKTADLIIIDTPPGMPDTTYQAALLADLMLLPCGASPWICSH
jgi:cellulose biosynthesis protein BcsQ